MTGPLADKVGKLALRHLRRELRLVQQDLWLLGAVIIFLVWLWLTNVAILFGAELNADTVRGRQIEQGHPPEREPFLEPRDKPE